MAPSLLIAETISAFLLSPSLPREDLAILKPFLRLQQHVAINHTGRVDCCRYELQKSLIFSVFLEESVIRVLLLCHALVFFFRGPTSVMNSVSSAGISEGLRALIYYKD